jgi:hypothetical protein
MYLLRNLPPTVESIKSISPQEFDEDGVKSITDCLSEMRRKFVSESELKALAWWNNWAEKHVSAFASANIYVRHQQEVHRKHFDNPLWAYLFGKEKPMTTVWNSKLSEVTSNINPGFQWPEIIAAATSSVTTDFNRHPPEPRAIFVEHTLLNDVLTVVNERIRAYYSSISTTSKVSAIKAVMNQKVQPSGNILKTANTTKPMLIERWKANDNVFLAAIFSSISPNNSNIVAQLCVYNPDDFYTPIESRKNKMVINRSILFEVNGTTSRMEFHGMNAIMMLFRNRNDQVMLREPNCAYKLSLFMNANSFSSIMNRNQAEPFDISSIDDQFIKFQVDKIYRIYFPYHQPNESWGMIIFDFNLSVIYYVDHGNESDDPVFID